MEVTQIRDPKLTPDKKQLAFTADKKHEDMGFEHGWGKALEQLVEYMKRT